MVPKSVFIDWKKGNIGVLFQNECNMLAQNLLAEMANRGQCENDRDMWIRGAIWAISEMAAWEPELTPEMGEIGEDE